MPVTPRPRQQRHGCTTGAAVAPLATLTFDGPHAAQVLVVAAPAVKGAEDVPGVAGHRMRQQVLEGAVLVGDAAQPVAQPDPQHRAVQQRQVVPVAQQEGEEQREEGQSDGRGHHGRGGPWGAGVVGTCGA